MPLSEKLSTAPYAEPISLTEMKLHLRMDATDDDALITSLIVAARQHVENYTQRQLVAATWKLYLNQFPQVCSWWNWESGNSYSGRYRRWLDDPYGVDAIRLGHSPLISVDSIQYVDTDGVTQTLASSVYTVDKNTEPARIVLAYGQSWPSTRAQLNAVTVTYKAGYASPFTRSQNTANVQGGYFAVSDRVRVNNSGGALPGGLVVNTDYLIATSTISDTTDIVTFADTDNQAITLTSASTGTSFIGEIPEPIRQAMKLLCSHWYENREAVLTGTISKEIDLAVESLLYPYRTMESVS